MYFDAQFNEKDTNEKIIECINNTTSKLDDLEDNCINLCIKELAVAKKDVSICDNIHLDPDEILSEEYNYDMQNCINEG